MDRSFWQGEYLTNRHFAAVLGATFLFHIASLYIYYVIPRTPVVNIPVRALNIRLGDVDVQDETAPQPKVPNAQQVEASMTKLMRTPVADKVPLEEAKTPKTVQPLTAPKTQEQPDAPRQFVRETKTKAAGSDIGNSTATTAEIKSRYEQTISLWIAKFKVYPEEARAAGMQGNTAVRIRIDRRGNIRYSALEQSTGYPDLDRAALDMVRRANPVPAVPNDYPQGEMFEFLIPVNFQMQ